ncbi:MAG: glycosyltransferase [Lachnospiraceae bacterium]|nr:glycosyltransferase [Lachnospiraceae bacterium]
MERDLISVVVPIYNVEMYIRKSVESILNQTYQNLEIILVDDGATDSCPFICDEYAAKDSRVKVIHKKNGGLSDARNVGVEVATGSFIGFVDSDDFLKPDMYEKMHQRLIDTGADIVVCNYECVKVDGTPIEERNLHMSVTDEVLTPHEAIRHLCGAHYEYWVTAWNRLYKAEVAKTIVFPKGKIHEDEYTAHMFYDSAEKIAGISEPLYQYVIRENSIMTRKYSVRNLAYVEALDGRIRYCTANKMYELALPFLRWMGKYLMQVYPQLDMNEVVTKNAYENCEILFWENYELLKSEKIIDSKTRLMAILMRMPKGIASIVMK